MAKNKIVDETLTLYKDYSKKRDTWAEKAKQDKEFRLGRQWTKEQEDTLKARGQAPIVVNRIHPAVETAKAMLTANRPSFRVAPREESDIKVANVVSNLLAYMYDISDGRTVVRNVVDDYYTMGVGYMHVYQDPMMDMGKGEVCIHDLDPLDVYVDPASQSRFFDDAENVIVSRLFTKEQAKKLWPMYQKKIDNANGENDYNAPETNSYYDGNVQFKEDVGQIDPQEYIRGYERYHKFFDNEFRVFEKFSGNEDLLTDEKYKEYVQRPAWIIEGQVITDQRKAQELVMQIEMQRMKEQAMQEQQMKADGIDTAITEMPNPPQPVKVQEVKYMDLIQMKQIEVVQVQVPRIKQCVIIGETLLYERVLPIEQYPVVPFINVHTRTPYPVSDVRLVKGLQEYINKTRSLIIAHATTSTNVKILVPEGSVDMADFEQKWAQPGVAIQYDPTDGAPMPVQPLPLPNELYSNEMTAKNDIDHQLGLYEMMMGNAQNAPQTYKGTISLDEFGQRKIRSKMADIEAGLTRIAQLAIPLMQQLYTTQKIFRVVQPNNSISEYMVNKRMVDDKSGEIQIVNNIGIGRYDVVVVAGSTLPTNRYAELEFYKEAYQIGLIDRQEVLKKTDVFDAEGVMQRIDLIQQLQSQLEQAKEHIKGLKGDLQTRDRESVNLRKKAEMAKFEAKLDKTKNKADAAGTIFEKRLDDTISTVKGQLADRLKDKGSPSSGKKQSKGKGKK
tara:strand:- start:1959 stop:4142 length:2184 start_codon:yes stop_codon:yes gene_type:complete